ncbi:MAG: hypothetical protein R3Y27_08270 [Clostridia bacterium]
MEFFKNKTNIKYIVISLIVLTIFTAIYFAISLSLGEMFSEVALQSQSELLSQMQNPQEITASCDEFTITFVYDTESKTTSIETMRSDNTSNVTTQSGATDQITDVLTHDAASYCDNIAYISINSQNAAYYIIRQDSSTEQFDLDPNEGFVIIAERESLVNFYDAQGNEVY